MTIGHEITVEQADKRIQEDPLMFTLWYKYCNKRSFLRSVVDEAEKERKRRENNEESHAPCKRTQIAKLESEFLENVVERDRQEKACASAQERLHWAYDRADQIALELAQAQYGKKARFGAFRKSYKNPGDVLLKRVFGLEYVVYDVDSGTTERLITGHVE